MERSDPKARVAALSVLSNTTLIILKVIAGALSGSVSIISEAIHSGMDLAASIIAFFSVKIAAHPADDDHPYGHGKVENVSGVIEGVLIFIAAALIILEAVKKILHPGRLNEATIGIVVMGLSAAVNMVISTILYRVAKREDSVALEADALHLKTDVYTSAGVAVGLLLIRLTKIQVLDSLVAIMVALLIVKESWNLTRHAFTPLLDAQLPGGDVDKIKATLAKYENECIDFHDLRTRKSGNLKLVELHMTVKKELSVGESHALGERIREELNEVLENLQVTIHVDPDKHDDIVAKP
ncbi:MAG TPA: cation diffusion facilitator family transporter [Bacillota bacterium]|nr:cation diffusion facilitator family transporter [Bacillota bacterium]